MKRRPFHKLFLLIWFTCRFVLQDDLVETCFAKIQTME